MRHLRRLFSFLKANDCGATAIEYALVAALMAMGVVVSVRAAMTASTNMWNTISTTVQAATN